MAYPLLPSNEAVRASISTNWIAGLWLGPAKINARVAGGLMGREMYISSNVNIAILIKGPRLFHQARHCAGELIDSGARVLLYYLCTTMPEAVQEAQLSMLKQLVKVECYLDDLQLAERYDLKFMPIAFLAEKLKTAERVIPF